MRDSAHAPISVHEVAQSLPARTYRQVSWRQGSDATLSSRFAGRCGFVPHTIARHMTSSGC
ncbi:putative ISXo8 transposase [Xanthomonas oryzae pv. oryzae KACC 10331]|uniref:ISXo8 transposase n=1 Tax=Xanthomonas oryzae pv. oryzae (strain KACC10331 / KXO85) TaxID=291331 RepID=Q5GV42_XANOR|nr:putative ISXo8 transposase [Xanthomonas oryzae pv. oryzae KACC 10331]